MSSSEGAAGHDDVSLNTSLVPKASFYGVASASQSSLAARGLLRPLDERFLKDVICCTKLLPFLAATVAWQCVVSRCRSCCRCSSFLRRWCCCCRRCGCELSPSLVLLLPPPVVVLLGAQHSETLVSRRSPASGYLRKPSYQIPISARPVPHACVGRNRTSRHWGALC